MNYTQAFLQLVDANELAYSILVDADAAGAIMPKYLSGPTVLDLGTGLALPTRINAGDAALEVTLSFSRQPFRCVIPWHAVLGVVLGRDTGRPTEIMFYVPEPEPAQTAPTPQLRLV